VLSKKMQEQGKIVQDTNGGSLRGGLDFSTAPRLPISGLKDYGFFRFTKRFVISTEAEPNSLSSRPRRSRVERSGCGRKASLGRIQMSRLRST